MLEFLESVWSVLTWAWTALKELNGIWTLCLAVVAYRLGRSRAKKGEALDKVELCYHYFSYADEGKRATFVPRNVGGGSLRDVADDPLVEEAVLEAAKACYNQEADTNGECTFLLDIDQSLQGRLQVRLRKVLSIAGKAGWIAHSAGQEPDEFWWLFRVSAEPRAAVKYHMTRVLLALEKDLRWLRSWIDKGYTTEQLLEEDIFYFEGLEYTARLEALMQMAADLPKCELSCEKNSHPRIGSVHIAAPTCCCGRRSA